MASSSDTQNPCFLCLKRTPHTPTQFRSNEKCLRNICHFLQSDTSAALLRKLAFCEKASESADPLRDKKYSHTHSVASSVVVNLCDPCNSVAVKFSLMINELEKIQLKVNHYSEQFHRILKEVEGPSFSMSAGVGRVNQEKGDTQLQYGNCQDAMAPSQAVEAGVKRWKPEVLPSRQEHVGGSITAAMGGPDLVGKAYYPPPVNTCCPEGKNSNWTIQELPLPTKESLEGIDHGKGSSFPGTGGAGTSTPTRVDGKTDAGISPHNATTVNMEEILETAFRTHFKIRLNPSRSGEPPHYICGFCADVIQLRSVKLHLTCKHPEKLLSFARLAPLPEDLFKDLCVRVLKEEMTKCPPVAEVPSENKKSKIPSQLRRICAVCGKDTHFLKDHMVRCHWEILRGRLEDLQKESGPL